MIFKRTKKYLMDCASIRLDSKINLINKERKTRVSLEHFWYTGQNKNINNKYNKLTNKEISPSNPPLISLIRRGMVTSKNPFLYTPNSIEDVFNNCKLDQYGTKRGLNIDEEMQYFRRNMMFESYDEICFGNSSEHWELKSFLSSSIILDILFESYDENLWRIVLGYMPLNIQFEKIRLDVVDVQKIYNILFEEHYQLFMTGIFRASEVVANTSSLFWKYYEERKKNDSIINNKLALIDTYLNDFYHEILKKSFDEFINNTSYYGYEGKAIQENSTYQSLESIISIQKEMLLYQCGEDSEVIKKKYDKKIWNHDFISALNRYNYSDKLFECTGLYLDDEDMETIYATYILDLSEKLLDSLSSFQSFREDNSHWQGNYLGYVKKYQFGNEILEYLKSGDKEILRPLISNRLRIDNDRRARERYFMKKHPDSDLAREIREFHEDLKRL